MPRELIFPQLTGKGQDAVSSESFRWCFSGVGYDNRLMVRKSQEECQNPNVEIIEETREASGNYA
jgi:hypothetical protein